MSTRSNVLLVEPRTTKQLYHHRDWYLLGVWLELFEALIKMRWTELKTEYTYRIDDYIRTLPRAYEDSDAEHGDLSYNYKITYGQYWLMILYKKAERTERTHVTSHLLKNEIAKEIYRLEQLPEQDKIIVAYIEELKNKSIALSKINPNI